MESEVPMDASIIRIPPHHYIHVLDQNTNIARVEIGPLTYIRQDNERSDAISHGFVVKLLIMRAFKAPPPRHKIFHLSCQYWIQDVLA